MAILILIFLLPALVLALAITTPIFLVMPGTAATLVTLFSPVWVGILSATLWAIFLPRSEPIGWILTGVGATIGVFAGRLIADQARQALPKNVSQ